VGVEQQLLDGDGLLALGEAQDDAVVAPHRLDVHVEALPEAGLDGHGPGRVDPGAEGREEADPPVADLVAEPLEDDRPVVGDRRRLGLLLDVADEVRRRPRVEAVLVPEALLGTLGPDLPEERADRPAELERTSGAVAVPERHLPGLAGRRGDEHPVVGDLLDPPRRGAEQEGVAGPALVDHLLVELADPGAVGQEDAEQAAVGDRAGVGHRDALRPGAGPERAAHPVPHQARPQLGELVARVPARQQVEHRGERVVGELGEGGRPADEGGQLVDRPVVHRHHGDDLLGQDVEGVAGVAGLLDEPLAHPVDHDRGLDEVAPVLGEDLAAARVADVVAGPADALQAARDRARRLDLDDEVDRPHVDAELEGARGHEGLEPARLQLVLDEQALHPAERPVVGLDEVAPVAGGADVVGDGGPARPRRPPRPPPARSTVRRGARRAGGRSRR
jgi:hypothetical protein